MCYDCAPWRLQSAIRQVFHLATRRIRIPGVEVVPVPLFEVLDGRESRDYVQRVEPSPRGGKKMAVALMDAIYGRETHPEDDESGGSADGGGATEGLVRHMRRD